MEDSWPSLVSPYSYRLHALFPQFSHDPQHITIEGKVKLREFLGRCLEQVGADNGAAAHFQHDDNLIPELFLRGMFQGREAQRLFSKERDGQPEGDGQPGVRPFKFTGQFKTDGVSCTLLFKRGRKDRRANADDEDDVGAEYQPVVGDCLSACDPGRRDFAMFVTCLFGLNETT